MPSSWKTKNKKKLSLPRLTNRLFHLSLKFMQISLSSILQSLKFAKKRQSLSNALWSDSFRNCENCAIKRCWRIYSSLICMVYQCSFYANFQWAFEASTRIENKNYSMGNDFVPICYAKSFFFCVAIISLRYFILRNRDTRSINKLMWELSGCCVRRIFKLIFLYLE